MRGVRLGALRQSVQVRAVQTRALLLLCEVTTKKRRGIQLSVRRVRRESERDAEGSRESRVVGVNTLGNRRTIDSTLARKVKVRLFAYEFLCVTT